MNEIQLLIKKVESLEATIMNQAKEEVMSLKEVVEFTKMSDWFIRNHIDEIGYIRRKKKIMFFKSDVIKWLKLSKVESNI